MKKAETRGRGLSCRVQTVVEKSGESETCEEASLPTTPTTTSCMDSSRLAAPWQVGKSGLETCKETETSRDPFTREERRTRWAMFYCLSVGLYRRLCFSTPPTRLHVRARGRGATKRNRTEEEQQAERPRSTSTSFLSLSLNL